MQGFLWLITQMALLLSAAAGVFFWLGWRWRGKPLDATHQSEAATTSSPLALPMIRETTSEPTCDEANPPFPEDPSAKLELQRLNQQLEEAEHHRRNLEKELIRVHDELKTARLESAEHKHDAQVAKEETARLLTELAAQRRELVKLQKELPQRVIENTTREAKTPTEKTKTLRPRKVTASSKEKSPVVPQDAASIQQRIQSQLEARRQLQSALQQERDDWQRRVTSLRESGKDLAGLNLARKSLERVEQQVADAETRLKQLEHQASALQRSLEASTHLSHEDDLTRIKGIKTILSDQLRKLGIKTFQQIATWSEEDTQAFSEILGFKDRAKRDAWVRQARELSETKTT